MSMVSFADMVIGGLTPVPRDRYTVRIKESNIATSKKEGAKPTLRVSCEIVAPEQVKVGDTTYDLAGRKFYLMPNSIDPSEGWGLGRIKTALDKSGFNFQEKFGAPGIDIDRLPLAITGHVMDMILDSKEEFEMRPANADEIARGITGEQYILDAADEKISRGYQIQASWDNVCKGRATAGGW